VELLDTFGAFVAVVGIVLTVSALSRRPDLPERLRPFQPSVGDEAEAWLRRR
jgi:hypothetical protein